MADKAGAVSSAPLPVGERLRVRHVGAPLRRGAGPAEFLFEVRSADDGHQLGCVQRGCEAAAELHERLVAAFPGAALPLPPAGGGGSALRRIFKTEDLLLQDSARQIEAYLNTLLAMPSVSNCSILLSFLEVTPAAGQPPLSAYAEAAEEGLLEASSEACRACRALCGGLRRALGRLDAEEEPPEPAEQMQRRREALLRQHHARTLQTRPEGELQAAGAKLAEWR